MNADKMILVVDDDQLIRCRLRDVLIDEGFQIVEASNGDQALQAIVDTSPDLVLLDLLMPSVSGLDVLLKLKGSAASIPIVVISSLDTQSLIDQAMANGATGFIGKPFHPTEVLDEIARVLPA